MDSPHIHLQLFPVDPKSSLTDDSEDWKWASSIFADDMCNFVRSSIKQCQQNHTLCSGSLQRALDPQAASRELPLRLLDTKPPGEEGGLKVLLCEEIGHVEYVTLSYTWGDIQPFMLTDANYDSCLDRIDLSSLPLTF